MFVDDFALYSKNAKKLMRCSDFFFDVQKFLEKTKEMLSMLEQATMELKVIHRATYINIYAGTRILLEGRRIS